MQSTSRAKSSVERSGNFDLIGRANKPKVSFLALSFQPKKGLVLTREAKISSRAFEQDRDDILASPNLNRRPKIVCLDESEKFPRLNHILSSLPTSSCWLQMRDHDNFSTLVYETSNQATGDFESDFDRHHLTYSLPSSNVFLIDTDTRNEAEHQRALDELELRSKLLLEPQIHSEENHFLLPYQEHQQHFLRQVRSTFSLLSYMFICKTIMEEVTPLPLSLSLSRSLLISLIAFDGFESFSSTSSFLQTRLFWPTFIQLSTSMRSSSHHPSTCLGITNSPLLHYASEPTI